MRWLRVSQRPGDHRARRPLAGRNARRSFRSASLALAGVLLASCGGDPILAPPVDPSPQTSINTSGVAAATPPATPVAQLIDGVVWATATDPATNAPINPVLSYRPDAPRIVAAVHMDALPAGSRVEATWEYNHTTLDAFTTRLTPPESGADRWISFHIDRDPEVDWPVGTYEVRISLNGTTVQEAAIEVREES